MWPCPVGTIDDAYPLARRQRLGDGGETVDVVEQERVAVAEGRLERGLLSRFFRWFLGRFFCGFLAWLIRRFFTRLLRRLFGWARNARESHGVGLQRELLCVRVAAHSNQLEIDKSVQ